MDHVTRLRLVGRASYYLGWIAVICGALVHLSLGTKMLLAVNVTQRNLLEASVLFFVISIASELRASPKQAA